MSFAGMRGVPLIHKLVKPIKVTGSRSTNKLRFNKLLVPKTQPQLRTADTAVLREPDAAVRQELAGFDMAGSRLDHPAEFFPLLVSDGGLEILNLREALPYEGDESHFGYAAHPGVAD